jgi:hypothetical protein
MFYLLQYTQAGITQNIHMLLPVCINFSSQQGKERIKSHHITSSPLSREFDLEQACLIFVRVVKSKCWVRVGNTNFMEGEQFWIRKNFTAQRYYSSF